MVPFISILIRGTKCKPLLESYLEQNAQWKQFACVLTLAPTSTRVTSLSIAQGSVQGLFSEATSETFLLSMAFMQQTESFKVSCLVWIGTKISASVFKTLQMNWHLNSVEVRYHIF